MQWVPIHGLTDDANTLMAENWSILTILQEDLDDTDRMQIIDMLIAVEKRFTDLGERKYR